MGDSTPRSDAVEPAAPRQTALARRVREYEERFAAVVGVEHALAFSYARVGLRAVLRALGAHPGDEIVLSPLTCKVVPLALLSLGLKLVYADISADTLNLDPDALEGAISPRSRAILFQHTYGSSTGIDQVAAVAARRGGPEALLLA